MSAEIGREACYERKKNGGGLLCLGGGDDSSEDQREQGRKRLRVGADKTIKT